MSNIRSYIKDHLLGPLKEYPTVIQDTMIELITQKLEELYEYSKNFPEIIQPHANRLDILQAIADQFLFTIREEADIQEQIDILENILYVYRIRGSIDSIENMWKYYGGDLPKEVEVVVPSYNLFRYSISPWSGTHSFLKGRSKEQEPGRVDSTSNSPGIYEVKLTNNTYPIDKLKEFMLKELVAAGTEIYFTTSLDVGVISTDLDSNPYSFYIDESNHRPYIYEKTEIHTMIEVLKYVKGLIWSGQDYHTLSNLNNTGYNLPDIPWMKENVKSLITESTWSGEDTRIEVEILKWLSTKIEDDSGNISYDYLKLNTYELFESLGFVVDYTIISREFPVYNIKWYEHKDEKNIDVSSDYSHVYCTPENTVVYIESDYYSNYGSTYPRYFVVDETLLVSRSEEGDE